jgi:hypothetical protein
MTKKPVDPKDDRRETRYEVEGEVELKVLFMRSEEMKEVRARLRNFGPGGIYAETEEDIPPGALAELNLKLEGRPLANTMGLVRWLRPGKGVGIEFFYSTDEEREALESYLSEWLATRRERN